MATLGPEETFRRVLASERLNIHTAMPGRVESYDADAQTVNVQPMIKNVLKDPDGTELVESFPVIQNVPVKWPRGGGYFIIFPLAKGDFVQLVFNEKSISQFFSTGKESHPIDLEKHGFSGATAQPGFYPEGQALQEDGQADGMLMGKEGGPQIFIDGSVIEFGKKGAGDGVPLDSKLQSELSNISTQIATLASNHVVPHTYISPLIPSSVIPTVPPAPSSASYSPGATASALVKIDE